MSGLKLPQSQPRDPEPNRSTAELASAIVVRYLIDFAQLLTQGTNGEAKLSDLQHLQDGISLALDGNAILLTGSGSTFGAKNIDGNYVPGIDRLLEILNEPYPANPFKNYNTAASRYVNDKELGGPGKLFARLRREFQISTITNWHRTLFSIPFKRVYTTNYDNLIEKTLGDLSINFKSLNAARDDRPYDPDRINIVHLNGMLDSYGQLDFDLLIRLTEASYISEQFSRRPYFANFRAETRGAGAIFVVGNRLMDIDITRIIQGRPDIQSKTFIICSASETPEDMYSLRQRGTVFPIGIEGLADNIALVSSTHSPRQTRRKFYSVKPIDYPATSATSITDLDRYQLYVNGAFSADKYIHQDDATGGGLYSVRRTAITRVTQRVSDGPSIHFVYGNLASGKSIFCTQLAAALRIKGVDVYLVDQQSEFVQSELEEVAKDSARPKVVIFENYERHLDDVRYCLGQFRTNISLILVARTHLHEATKRDVVRMNLIKLKEHDVNLDRLDQVEIEYLARVLSSDEFRGAFPSGADVNYIKQAVRGVCDSRMGEVLLFLLRSPHIQDRVRQQISDAKLSSDDRRNVLIAFVMRVLGVQIKKSELDDGFLGGAGSNADLFGRDGVQELIRFDNTDTLMCSSALARYCTSSVFAPNEVRRALTEIAKRSYNLRTDALFKETYESSIQHGKIKELFSINCVDDELALFYDELKNFGCARDNPYFWLQFAIAMWTKRERGLVDGYLSRAREAGSAVAGFRPYQIDNFDAKVRLETILFALKGYPTRFSDIEYAASVILSQLPDEKTRDYPLHLIVRLCKVAKLAKAGLKQGEIGKLIGKLTSIEHRLPDSVCGSEYPEFSDACEKNLRLAVSDMRK